MPDSPPDRTITLDEIIDQSVTNPSIPQLYANGFAFTKNRADLLLLLLTNGVPRAVVNLPLDMCQALGESLIGAAANTATPNQPSAE